jgi:hypothetical protein
MQTIDFNLIDEVDAGWEFLRYMLSQQNIDTNFLNQNERLELGVACSCKNDRSDQNGEWISEFREIKYVCVIALASKVEAKKIIERLPWYQIQVIIEDPDTFDKSGI